MSKIASVIPKSVTSYPINLAGVIVYLISLYFVRKYETNAFIGAIISLGALAATILILEKIFLNKSHKKSSGIDFSKASPINWKRLGIKLLGLYVTLGIVTLFYWILPCIAADSIQTISGLQCICFP